MAAFTIFGILSYWFLMGVIGYWGAYGLRVYLDLRKGVDLLLEPVNTAVMELEVLLKWLDKPKASA